MPFHPVLPPHQTGILSELENDVRLVGVLVWFLSRTSWVEIE